MHYYQFNIGNYYRDTSGLAPLEDLAYRRAIDKYHLTEHPLNGCSTDVAKRLGLSQHKSEVDYILNEYFDFKDGSWHHTDIDETIRAYHTGKNAKKEAGIKSGEARRRKAFKQVLKSVQSNDEQNADSVELTNNHKPITNNHKPITKGKSVASIDAILIFEYWKSVNSKPGRMINTTVTGKIKARLKKFTVDQIKQAIDGNFQSLYHQGQNDQNKKYISLELICRNDEKLQDFMDRASQEIQHDTEMKAWLNCDEKPDNKENTFDESGELINE